MSCIIEGEFIYQPEYHRRVISDYSIEEFNIRENGNRDIKVNLFCNGELHFSSRGYKNISSETVEKIRKILESNIPYNRTVENECEAVAWVTIIYLIENI